MKGKNSILVLLGLVGLALVARGDVSGDRTLPSLGPDCRVGGVMISTPGGYYAVGGGNVGGRNQIVFVAVDANGLPRSAVAAGEIAPYSVGAVAAAISGRWLYVSGGDLKGVTVRFDIADDGTLSNRVEYADGDRPKFKEPGMVSSGKYLVIGGGWQTRLCYQAEVRSDGSLGPWMKQRPLPSICFCGGRMFRLGKRIYAAGNQTYQGATDRVFSTEVAEDGAVTKWRRWAELPEKGASFCFQPMPDGKSVFYCNLESGAMYDAPIVADGEIGDWRKLAGTMPEGPYLSLVGTPLPCGKYLRFAVLIDTPRAFKPSDLVEMTPAAACLRQRAGTGWKMFDRRLGVFVHWGIYAVGGWHEQQQMRMGLKRTDYEKNVAGFTAERFDADALVSAAESAGATYLVLTAKHHDGFCLWDTATTDYGVMKSPCGRDIVKEVSEACSRRGMMFGLYYSNPDWHHPNAYNPKSSHQLDGPQPGDEPDLEKYVVYVRAQITELCTRYGRLCCFFWDIPSNADVPELNERVRRLQPGIEINDRGWGPGDYSTPERNVPVGSAFTRKTEACDSVDAESWGYRSNADYHTVGYLTRSIDRTLSMGGNFLLNVGPRADGRITGEAADLLWKVGAWHRRVAESYRGVETVTNVVADSRCIVTVRGRTTYVHYPRGLDRRGVDLSPISERPESVVLLNTGRSLPFELVPMPWSYQRLRRACLHISGIPADELSNESVVLRIEFAPEKTTESPSVMGRGAKVDVEVGYGNKEPL